MKHVFRIIAISTVVIVCTLLPFLPGRFDSMAVPLSAMALVAGTGGLVLVPVGVFWLAAERSQRLARGRYLGRLLAAAASLFVCAATALAAIAQSGFALGIIAVVLCAYVVYRSLPMFKQTGGELPASDMLPLYLIILPVVIATMQHAFLDHAVTFSRNRAIRNSASLITAIELHRRTYGRYPVSLWSVNPDFWPGVIGIPKYHYEPSGDAYNLFFEQFTHRLGVREFVMYNPRDEHAMTSHAVDILELAPEQLAIDRTRGHNALHATPHPHWKYFWFD